jgi:hypothetical protein
MNNIVYPFGKTSNRIVQIAGFDPVTGSRLKPAPCSQHMCNEDWCCTPWCFTRAITLSCCCMYCSKSDFNGDLYSKNKIKPFKHCCPNGCCCCFSNDDLSCYVICRIPYQIIKTTIWCGTCCCCCGFCDLCDCCKEEE